MIAIYYCRPIKTQPTSRQCRRLALPPVLAGTTKVIVPAFGLIAPAPINQTHLLFAYRLAPERGHMQRECTGQSWHASFPGGLGLAGVSPVLRVLTLHAANIPPASTSTEFRSPRPGGGPGWQGGGWPEAQAAREGLLAVGGRCSPDRDPASIAAIRCGNVLRHRTQPCLSLSHPLRAEIERGWRG